MDFLKYFIKFHIDRIINAVKPDRQVLLEIQLLSRGFTQASQMAKKLSVFLDLTGVLLSTVPKPGTLFVYQ